MRSLIIAVSMIASILFASPAEARNGLIIAVGDSNVQGYGLANPGRDSWVARIGAAPAGSSGGCVISYCYGQDPMILHFDAAVLVHRPDVVIINYGINDLAVRQHGSEAIVDGLANLVWRARQSGVRKVYVQALLPIGPRIADLEPHRLYVNALIRARFANVIDHEPSLRNPNTGWLKWAYDSGDNIHPNAEGHRVMAVTARAALQ